MKLGAYIMLSDAEWLPVSLASYYDVVETIFVSYDEDGLGWTGRPIDMQPALDLLPSLDLDKKIRLLPGRYAHPGHTPIENDTYQRQRALDALAAEGYAWALQVDTDEVFSTLAPLPRLMAEAERIDAGAIEWPMHTYFQRLPDGRYLEVRGARRQVEYSYPGPVLIRTDQTVTLARRTSGKTLRPAVEGDTSSPSLQPSSIDSNVQVETLLRPEEAIHHFSWVRSESAMRAKLATWGHSTDFNAERFYRKVWMAAPRRWRWMRDFHPLRGCWWPRLEAVHVELAGGPSDRVPIDQATRRPVLTGADDGR